jgi:hypothetical protein
MAAFAGKKQVSSKLSFAVIFPTPKSAVAVSHPMD